MSNRPGGEDGGGAGHAGRMNLNDPRLTGPAIAAGRVVLGVVAIARPALPARCWVSAERAGEPGVQVLARALGARDVALGVVALAACARGSAGSRRATVGLGAFADGVDAAATLLGCRAAAATWPWPPRGAPLRSAHTPR
jgi:hypothetical protein